MYHNKFSDMGPNHNQTIPYQWEVGLWLHSFPHHFHSKEVTGSQALQRPSVLLYMWYNQNSLGTADKFPSIGHITPENTLNTVMFLGKGFHGNRRYDVVEQS